MAAVLEVAAGISAMSSSRTLQGGVVCNTSAASRTVCNVASSSATSAVVNGAAFPTCRGLKVVKTGGLARRLSATTTSGSASSQSLSGRIVSENRDATIGGRPPPPSTATGLVNDKTFQKEVLDSKVPVLVDFWAPWCGPCRMIAPVIDELAVKYAGKLKCLKLNTDECPQIATEYGIRSIPTVMIFKKGEKKDTVIGAVPGATLAATVEKYLD